MSLEAGSRAPGPLAEAPVAVACGVSLFLSLCQTWLLNESVFPVTSVTFPLGREIQTLAGIVLGCLVVLAAARRPGLLRPAPLAAASVPCCLAGAVLLCAAPAQPWAATAGLVLAAAGNAWNFYLLGAALSTMRPGRAMGVSLTLAVLGAAAVTTLAPRPGYAAGVLVRAALCLAQLALLYAPGRDVIERVARGQAGQDLRLSNPRSFLPAGSQTFALILLFSAAFGFALSFGIDGYTPAPASQRLVIVALAVAWFALARSPVALVDTLFAVAALLMVAGFAFAPVSHETLGSLSNALLYAGNYCFGVLYWLTLAALCQRNPAGALTFLGWGDVCQGVGTFVGADAGHLCNALAAGQPGVAWAVTGAIVVALFAYLLLGLRDFSFSKTIGGVVPAVAPQAPPAPQAEAGFEERLQAACDALADENGVTEREREVMGLLVRGHGGQHIAQALTLSYNTVKTHVKRVYQKTGVHSQQELIDLAYGRAGLEDNPRA